MTADLGPSVGQATSQQEGSLLETQKNWNNIEFEKFLYFHIGCKGFTQDGNKAKCTTHNVSAEGAEGYLAK